MSRQTMGHRPRRTRTAGAGAWLLLVSIVVAAADAALAQTVSRGPYLQMGGPTEMTVRWRTDSPTDSVVRYGPGPDDQPFVAQEAGNRTEHEVVVSGLDPATRYFYSVGDSIAPRAGGDSDHMFVTSPLAGTEQPTRIWVVGDSGTANASARAVRDAYLALTGDDYTHLFLMLGDNAYDDGTDREYQRAVFDTYPTILRQTPVWPTLGNHDGRSADSGSESGVYYNIFTLPRLGELGGMASGTEAYYSFDYANIHFIVLDSFDSNRSANGAMMTWLRDDLISHLQPWVIAFWHHPPYSKGSHDSDSESYMVQMRQNALPILEAGGVDLVLSGHSHSYERSYLIDGHYGRSGSFNASHQIDGGDGRVTGDGAYRKPGEFIGDPNQGAVYVVAGSSGKISGGPLNHRAMRVSMNRLGSMVLEVDGDTLDAAFLDNNGVIRDTFRIDKTPSGPPLPQVSVVASEPTAAEDGSVDGRFTVSRTGETADALAVIYTASGTATPGVDYVGLSGTVTIATGQTSATVDVEALDDSLVEEDEAVVLTVAADAAYEVGTPGNATVTIESDDVGPPPTGTVLMSTAFDTFAGWYERGRGHWFNRAMHDTTGYDFAEGSGDPIAEAHGGRGQASRLIMNKIDTSAYAELTIDFQRYLSAAFSDPTNDFLKFEAKGSDGWHTIRHWGGSEPGADGVWHDESVTLTAADGPFFWPGFRIRFHYNGGRPDWAGIDDVVISARPLGDLAVNAR